MNQELTKDILTSNPGMAEIEKDSEAEIIEWVNQIQDKTKREVALSKLVKNREFYPEIALYLWYSSGTVSICLQELLSIYPLLDPSKLTLKTSNKACNSLALFQIIAAHPDTRPAFLKAQIPIFLYPFLNTVSKTKPFEYLRLTALGVIGALVKEDNTETIAFLLDTEIIPLCLRIMERGCSLSRTVASFVLLRILLHNNGLSYICLTAERFLAVSTVLNQMITNNPPRHSIKHIIRAFARLSDNPLARNILLDNLPSLLKDPNYSKSLDQSSQKWLTHLLKTLSEKSTCPLLSEPTQISNNSTNLNKAASNLTQIPLNQQSVMRQPSNNPVYNYQMIKELYMSGNSNSSMLMSQGGNNFKGADMNQNPYIAKK